MNKLHRYLLGSLALVSIIAGYSLGQILKQQPLQAVVKQPPQQTTLGSLADQEQNFIGKKRVDFTLPDLQNTPRTISDWDGKALLINFWATWCAPCREEIPAFIEVQQAYQAAGFEVLGIAIDLPDIAYEYAQESNINYTILHGQQSAIEIGRQLGNLRGGLPYSVFIDKKGVISHIHSSGAMTLDMLNPIIQELTGGNSNQH